VVLDVDIKKIQEQLLRELPGLAAQMLMAPPIRRSSDMYGADVKLGGVLVLLYPIMARWHVLLMQRSEDGGTHSGQISFPGGKYDNADGSITYTAIREANEEVGLDNDCYAILGNLTSLYIPPSNFLVTPLLAIAESAPTFTRNVQEVQQILQVPLHDLFSPQSKTTCDVLRSDNNSISMHAPAYQLHGADIIWGATAMMLSELEVLLDKCH
jgi:8-oxo-dGTP pyrophosphatase MutT (NUDIX family)